MFIPYSVIRVVLTAFALSALVSAEMREWTDSQGRKVNAEYVSIEAGNIKMKLANGKIASVPFAKLSESDQAWVKERHANPPTLPEPQPPTAAPPAPAPVSPTPPQKQVNWVPLKDLGEKIPDLPAIPEPDPNALIPVVDGVGGRYFYMRPDGSDAFPHLTFKNSIMPFSDGLAWVETKDHKGYINREGKWVLGGDGGAPLPEGGYNFEAFREGRAMFRLNSYVGFIDTSGKVVIAADRYYSAQGAFSNGLCAVNDKRDMREESWCYIDRDGKVAIPGPWPAVADFSEGVAWVCLDRSAGVQRVEGRKRLINTKGENVFGEAVFLGSLQYRAEGGFISVSGRIYRTDGSVFLEPQDDYNLMRISKDGTMAFGVIKGDSKARIVHLPSMSVYGPFVRGCTGSFVDGYIVMWLHDDPINPYTCIDRSGQRALADSYATEPVFKDGFAVVRKRFSEKEERTLVINRKGDVIWKGEPAK
jgi:SLA1 homology domain 1, SHD1/WG containing repeat